MTYFLFQASTAYTVTVKCVYTSFFLITSLFLVAFICVMQTDTQGRKTIFLVWSQPSYGLK